MNAMTRVALQSLIRHIGLLKSIKLSVGLGLDQMRDRPFQLLLKASDRKEKESCKTLGRALLMDLVIA